MEQNLLSLYGVYFLDDIISTPHQIPNEELNTYIKYINDIKEFIIKIKEAPDDYDINNMIQFEYYNIKDHYFPSLTDDNKKNYLYSLIKDMMMCVKESIDTPITYRNVYKVCDKFYEFSDRRIFINFYDKINYPIIEPFINNMRNSNINDKIKECIQILYTIFLLYTTDILMQYLVPILKTRYPAELEKCQQLTS
jgi:hypothetical protein